MGNARLAALTALEKCRRSGAWSDAVLGSVLDKAGLGGSDRGLAVALCYCVLQNRMLLDYYIDCYSSVKSEKMEPKVLDILRISAAQLLYMDRIPVSAAVNEGVSLCRKLGYVRASGLVNAVLRRIAENREHLPAVEANTGIKRLSITYSCPEWLVTYYLDNLGNAEAEKLLRCQNAMIPVSVQVNTCLTDTETLLALFSEKGLDAKMRKDLPDAIEISNVGDVAKLPGFSEGYFYVQDAAAKFSVFAAAPKAEDRILDVCAAPGGKSFAASILSGGGAEIISCDLHENKLKRIEDGAMRLRLGNIRTFAADGSAFRPEWQGIFDIVIADVPCSGLGVIRKKPDIRYKSPDSFTALPEIQGKILKNAAKYVKPDGVLMYSTCTIRSEENQQVVEKFLFEHKAFIAEPFDLPNGRRVETGMLQLWPQRDNTDGFFIAKLRRNQ